LDVSEIDNPLRFQGQYFDAETGLHYNRHRYYNPGTGRFLTPDPIKLAGGLNSYQYVPNPMGWVDPLGLTTTKAQCPKKKIAVNHKPSGDLDWNGVDKNGLSRADHVERHGVDDPTRNVPHGVFAEKPISATENAWAIAKRDGIAPYVEQPGNGNWIYDVPYPNAGFKGGKPGATDGHPVLNSIRIVVKANTNNIVTAFPM
jgi:RHS repeat-associated protein